MIANFGETEDCQGHWIAAKVRKDGRFTLVNSRNGFAKTYQSK